MADGPITAEAVVRLEHKVDQLLWLILHLMRTDDLRTPLPKMGEATTCPICTKDVLHHIDQLNKVVTRKCACTTGLLPPINIDELLPNPGGNNARGESRSNAASISSYSNSTSTRGE